MFDRVGNLMNDQSEETVRYSLGAAASCFMNQLSAFFLFG
jgi:hypothetical protein